MLVYLLVHYIAKIQGVLAGLCVYMRVCVCEDVASIYENKQEQALGRTITTLIL